MTGNAGPILLITNKGRTIRKVIRGGGGGEAMYKKNSPTREIKKIHARQLTLKNIHTTA